MRASIAGAVVASATLVVESSSSFKEEALNNRDLPKGQWRCHLCRQEFCTPVSCLEQLKAIRQDELAVVTASSLEGDGQMKNGRGEAMEDTREGQVADEARRRVEADKATTLNACDECKRTNGQHDQKCSYNIANLI